MRDKFSRFLNPKKFFAQKFNHSQQATIRTG